MTRERAFSVFNLFFLSDRVVIPTSATTASGYTVSVEPVEVVDCKDRNALKCALEKTISRGRMKIPDLPDDELIFDGDGATGLKNPIELKYAGVSNWDDLERKSINFFVECYPSGYLIECWDRAIDGKWADSHGLKARLPSSIELDGLIDEIYNHLKTRKDLPGLSVGVSK